MIRSEPKVGAGQNAGVVRGVARSFGCTWGQRHGTRQLRHRGRALDSRDSQVVQLERDAHAAVAARAAQLRLRRRVATQQEGVLLGQRLDAWWLFVCWIVVVVVSACEPRGAKLQARPVAALCPTHHRRPRT